MKKYLSKFKETLLVSCLSLFLLVSCGGGGGNNELFNNNSKTSTPKTSETGGNNNSTTTNSSNKENENNSVGTNTSGSGSHEQQSNNDTNENNDDSEVLDETNYPDFVFAIGNFLKPVGSVTISFSSDPVSSPNVTIPAKVKIDGEVYDVFDDSVEPGLGYKMGVESITLPEGFKQLAFGFNQDMNLKTVKIPSTLDKITCHILVGCVSFEKIEYNGTKAQWEAIQKDDYWNYLAKAFIVVCKDGNIEIPAWE